MIHTHPWVYLVTWVIPCIRRPGGCMDSSSSFLTNLLSWQINPLKDPLFKPMEGFVQGDFYIQEQELLTFSYIFFFIIVHPHVSEFSFRLNFLFDHFRAVTYIGGLAMTHGSAHDSKRLAFSIEWFNT